jgi:hypothetical protein
MKPKLKNKLMVLLGYQLSNLAWIGAWFTYGEPLFPFCIGLICVSDILIIWKEI